MGINRVCISGNLTRDAELRNTANGTAVLGFGVAVDDRRRNQQTGEWEDYPNFVDCTMFGTRAEKLSQYLMKGVKVAIEGKLRYGSWEQNGQKRGKLEVIVEELEFFGGGQRHPQQQCRQQPQKAYQPVQYRPPQFVEADVYDDDIPF